MADVLNFYRERTGPVQQISVRVTDEQAEFLEEFAEKIGVTKADVFRMALDYWLQHGPHAGEAKEVLKKRGGK